MKPLFGHGDYQPLIALSECEEEKFEPLIDGIFSCRDFVLMHGFKDTLKSWTAAYMAVCVATGAPFFGREIKAQGRVVYVYGEGRMIKRLKALCKGLSIPTPSNIYPYYLRADLSSKDAQYDLIRHVPEGTVFVVIDNYEKFWSSSIDESTVASAVSFVREISEHAAILLVQHEAKSRQKDPPGHAKSIGSVRLVNSADGRLGLARKGAEITCDMYSREEDKPIEITFKLEKLEEDSFRLEQTKNIGMKTDMSDDMCLHEVRLRLANELTGSHTSTSIYDKHLKGQRIKGLSSDAWFNRLLPTLTEQGFLMKNKIGQYELGRVSLPEASEK